MTRNEILESYKVENGRIVSPGQFEGEPIYVPYLWDSYLNGGADDDDGEILTFDIADDDIAVFPELAGIKTVRLYQRSDGFVCVA